MGNKPRYYLDTLPAIADATRELLNESQRIKAPVRTVPNIVEISEGELIVFDDGSDRRIYTKLNGALYYVNLTAV